MSDYIAGHPTPIHDPDANRLVGDKPDDDDNELVVDPTEFGDPLPPRAAAPPDADGREA